MVEAVQLARSVLTHLLQAIDIHACIPAPGFRSRRHERGFLS